MKIITCMVGRFYLRNRKRETHSGGFWPQIVLWPGRIGNSRRADRDMQPVSRPDLSLEYSTATNLETQAVLEHSFEGCYVVIAVCRRLEQGRASGVNGAM